MYDVEKQSEVVRENGSYRTVWNQCCLSPWVRQTQKSSESEIVMVNSSEMNAGLRDQLTTVEGEGGCGEGVPSYYQ